MDEDIREAFSDLKRDNKESHDEIKSSITCLPCNRHSEQLMKHETELAVLKYKPTALSTNTTTNQYKLDWRIVGILAGVITALVILIDRLVIK